MTFKATEGWVQKKTVSGIDYPSLNPSVNANTQGKKDIMSISVSIKDQISIKDQDQDFSTLHSTRPSMQTHREKKIL